MFDNNNDVIEEENIEYYKAILQQFIINRNTNDLSHDNEMKKYISAFSLYLRISNNAYMYNLPYLTHYHNEFVNFLNSALSKYFLLTRIVEKINQSVVKWKKRKSFIQELSKLTISINDIFTADLSGVIKFHETLSTLGATRNSAKDTISIRYSSDRIDKMIVCKDFILPDGYTLDSDKILNTVKVLIGERKEIKGEYIQNGIN